MANEVQAQQVIVQGVLDFLGMIPAFLIITLMSNLMYDVTGQQKPQVLQQTNKAIKTGTTWVVKGVGAVATVAGQPEIGAVATGLAGFMGAKK